MELRDRPVITATKTWSAWPKRLQTGATFGFALFAFFTDFANSWHNRAIILLAIGVVWAVGKYWGYCQHKKFSDHKGDIRSQLAQDVLRDMAEFLFMTPQDAPKRAWRISMYELVVDSANKQNLHRLIRASSTDHWASPEHGRHTIALKNSCCREIGTGYSLEDWYANTSGELADPQIDRDNWIYWQSEFGLDKQTIAALRMPTRKYGWGAIKVEKFGTLVAIVESCDPSGVDMDALKQPVTGAVMVALFRLLKEPALIESKEDV